MPTLNRSDALLSPEFVDIPMVVKKQTWALDNDGISDNTLAPYRVFDALTVVRARGDS